MYIETQELKVNLYTCIPNNLDNSFLDGFFNFEGSSINPQREGSRGIIPIEELMFGLD